MQVQSASTSVLSLPFLALTLTFHFGNVCPLFLVISPVTTFKPITAKEFGVSSLKSNNFFSTKLFTVSFKSSIYSFEVVRRTYDAEV